MKNFYIILVVGAFILMISLSPIFDIKQVNIKGNVRISDSDILKASTLDTYKSNIFLYSSDTYKKVLESNPYIKTTTIRRILPNTIEVDITERNLIAYILYGENTYLYVDDTGIILEANQSITDSLPIITGIDFDKFSIGSPIDVKNPDSLKVAEKLSPILKRYNLNNENIKMDAKNPDDIHLYIGNLNVVFGDVSGADEKVRRTIAAIDSLPDKNVKGFLYVNDLSTDSYVLKIIS